MKLKVVISEINAVYLSILSLIQNVFTLFLHSLKKVTDSVAQLVEQYTFNVWVLGSSPSRITSLADNLRGFLFGVNLLF